MSDPIQPTGRARVRDRRASVGEFAIVFGLTAGWSIVGFLASSSAEANAATFTDEHLVGLVAYELLLAAVLVPWLSTRGWSPRAIAGSPEPADVARGACLWIAAALLGWTVSIAVGAMWPEILRPLTDGRFGGGASAVAVTLVSVLNPVFEEFLWLGYAIPSLAPRLGLGGAAAVSIALRVSVHAYQGAWAFMGILPVAVLLTTYYARTRRLWPVIVAHVILDAVGLAQFLAARS